MKRRISRRHLLRGAGGVAIGLPFLNAMEVPRAKAQGPKPKRLVVMYSPNGFNTFPSSMNLAGTPLEPLERHKSRLQVIRGADLASAKVDPTPLDKSHYLGWAHLLTGANVLGNNVAGGISFDMLAAQRIGTSTAHPYSLHGIPHDEGQSPVSWLGPGAAAQAEIRPDRKFNKLFSNLDVDPDAQQARITQQKSVLDYVKGSLSSVQCELDYEDRQRLEQHVEAIRDVEMRLGLGGGGGAACAKPANPGGGLGFAGTAAAQRELLAMAFACDLTRVGSLQFSHVAGGGTPTWVDAGMPDTHHEISHRQDPDGKAWMKAIGAWYAEEMAKFIDLLVTYKDADGTPVIDNTAVVWVHECGFPAYDHIGDLKRSVNMSIVIAGGGGGTLKQNQFLDLKGTPHQNLWLELINALSPDGMANLSTFGNPATCTGGVPKIRA
ncbi:MAG: DUF1552 domain-containing protein [Myxococcales bacterium]|nr:DUF1552 domain-containing protein [Myxococcales bacterium]